MQRPVVEVVPALGCHYVCQGVGEIVHHHLWLARRSTCEVEQEVVGHLVACRSDERRRLLQSAPEVVETVWHSRTYRYAVAQHR